MAVTENTYTGNGSQTLYSFTFPYLEREHVKVSLNAVTQPTTAYTFANATTISFNTAPGLGVAIRIYRDTPQDNPPAEFFAGSAIRAQDLNENFLQQLYIAQETANVTIAASTGNLAENSITNFELAPNSVTATEIVDGTITNAEINATAAIAGSKITPNFGSQALTCGAINSSGTIQGGSATLTDVSTSSFILASGAIASSASSVYAGTDVIANNNLVTNNQGELRLKEATANGSNYVGFEAPASVASNVIWRLPAADGAADTVLTTNGSGVLSWSAPNALFQSHAVLADVPGFAVAGGSAPTAGITIRNLNTKLYDPDNIVILSSNQFTLGPGTYVIKWSAPAYRVNKHKANLTTAAGGFVRYGTNEFSGSVGAYAQTRSIGTARIVVASPTAYVISHYTETARATDGFGLTSGLADETYTIVEIYKEI